MENGAVHVDVVDKKGHSALFAAAVSAVMYVCAEAVSDVCVC